MNIKTISRSSILNAKVLMAAEKHLQSKDATLCRVIKAHGPCTLCQDSVGLFEKLVGSIIGQQLSVKAAKTIRARVQLLVGQFCPDSFLNAPIDELRKAGLSRAKIRYVTTLSEMVKSRDIILENLGNLPPEEAIKVLSAVPGVGRWTAEMFLLFALKHADILALNDVGLQRAVKKLYGEETTLEKLGKIWKPYNSVASWYLWKYLDSTP